MNRQKPQEIDAYFPHTGIISLVVNLASGEMIETGMIGRDSLLGGSAGLNGKLSLNTAVVQIAGEASNIESGHLISLADASISFRTAPCNSTTRVDLSRPKRIVRHS